MSDADMIWVDASGARDPPALSQCAPSLRATTSAELGFFSGGVVERGNRRRASVE
jgi:hypothetical protein